jgi:hypothetical protein
MIFNYKKNKQRANLVADFGERDRGAGGATCIQVFDGAPF